jgi:nicotinamidase-related amidase
MGACMGRSAVHPDVDEQKHEVDGKASRAKHEAAETTLQADKLMERFDANKDGVLSLEEVRELMSVELNETELAMEKLMELIDTDHDGKVGLNELRVFLRWYQPGNPDKEVRTKSALIIIDVQNDFISGSLANPYHAEEIVPVINDLRSAFDLVVVSLDWHPHHHCSFVESANDGQLALAAEHQANESFAAFTVVKLAADADRPEHEQALYPRHAVQDTDGARSRSRLTFACTHPLTRVSMFCDAGAACHRLLETHDSDPRIYKGTNPNIDSYSAFFDNCRANDTGLTELLTRHGITHVYCCGLVFDICVKSSALHGAEMGFKVSVIEDACRPLDQGNVDRVRDELKSAGVEILTAAEAKMAAAAERGSLLNMQQFLSDARVCRDAKRLHAQMPLAAHSRLSQSS